MSEIYSLYLNSVSSSNPYMQIPTATIVQRNYAINWDVFFSGANYRFKKCKVRFEFYSDPSTNTTTQMDPLTYNAVLGLTGVQGLATVKYGATIIGLLSLATVQPAGATPAIQTCLTGANVTGPGMSVNMPTGMADLGVGIYQNAVSPLTPISTALFNNWALILHFELYDPIE